MRGAFFLVPDSWFPTGNREGAETRRGGIEIGNQKLEIGNWGRDSTRKPKFNFEFKHLEPLKH